jgi:D-alanine-D-alanine ligase
MGRYDCVILYNEPRALWAEGSEEQLYPATVLRADVPAIEESLREAGFNPCVLAATHFSKDLVHSLLKIAPRFVFNLCEEINGKSELEMCLAGLLDLMGLPYTGSGPFALALALHKFRVKQILRAARIPVARGYLDWPGRRHGARSIHFPVIVKPAHEDGSYGINTRSVCHDIEQLDRQVNYIRDVYRQEALVEEYLEGREFNVSIVGDKDPEVLAISEIDFSCMPEGEPRIVSYRAKWDEESPMYAATVPVCPADIPSRLAKRVKDLALRSYRCVCCRDYGRVDIRTDAWGIPYVLEVNPNPDISPQAGFARAAKVAGHSYSEIILRISRAALERGANSVATVYAF